MGQLSLLDNINSVWILNRILFSDFPSNNFRKFEIFGSTFISVFSLLSSIRPILGFWSRKPCTFYFPIWEHFHLSLLDHSTSLLDHPIITLDHFTTPLDHLTFSLDPYTTPLDHLTFLLDHSTTPLDHSTFALDHSTTPLDHSTFALDHSTTHWTTQFSY